MKLNKILAALLLASTLMLSGCGGNNNSSSKKPSGSGSQSQPADDDDEGEDDEDDWGDDEEEEDESGVTIESIELSKNSSGKIIVEVKGTDEGEGAKKWCWGLASNGEFVLGDSADDTDFTKGQAYTLDAQKGFTVTWDLSTALAAIAANFESGNYSIYGGNELSYRSIGVTDESFVADDADFRYYVRSDLSGGQLSIEKKPPVELATAVIVKDTLDATVGEHWYLKVGGAKNSSVTADVVASWSPYADFEPVPWANATRRNLDETLFMKIEGNNFYAYFQVDDLNPDTNYLLHFNHNGQKTNCFTTGKIDNVEYDVDGITYTVYSNPAAGQAGGADEFYGCLAIKIGANPNAGQDDSSEAE